MSALKTAREFLKSAYHACTALLPVRTKAYLDFIRTQGYIPDFKNPRTFNEMLCARKLSSELDRYSAWADKIESKRLVSVLLGERYLIPSLYEGDFPTAEKYNSLPTPFVLKASNASGANIFVWNESDKDYFLHKDKIISKRDRFLKVTLEKFYSSLENRFIVEPILIGTKGKVPEDIKFHTFNGKVAYIQVDLDRFGEHTRNFYTPDWTRQPFSCRYKQSTIDPPKPACLDEMIRFAETIARDFDYVRVDLYEINGAPLFGELTFVHEEGYGRFQPREADKMWGSLWKA